MLRILVVFTGGTIGSRVQGQRIDTDPGAAYRLLDLFGKQFQNAAPQFSFSTIAPLQILSENLHPRYWETLVSHIKQELPQNYDGIVITHGTDTLTYTACALSFCLPNLSIPLVLVSSNFTLGDPRANGLNNFNCALQFIRQRQEGGVFVAYQNPDENCKVHLGSRLEQCQPLTSIFRSAQNRTYLEFDGLNFQEHHTPPIKQISQSPHNIETASLQAKILLIQCYPGMNYRQFNLDQANVILHSLYHSGTACVDSTWGTDFSLLEFCKFCRDQGKELYLVSAIKSPDAYASTHELMAAGAKILWNLTQEAAYVKLLLAYSCIQDPLLRQTFVESNLACEYLD